MSKVDVIVVFPGQGALEGMFVVVNFTQPRISDPVFVQAASGRQRYVGEHAAQ